MVLGGDGYMLQSIREVGASHVFLGINAGRVGFLLNDPEDFEAVVDALESRAWTVHTFPRLRMLAHTADGASPTEALAVNDVYLERMSGQTAHLQIEIDDVPVVDRLVCDGIIASTALGSTAYHFSASGHACHPGVRAIHPHPHLYPFSASRPDHRCPQKRRLRLSAWVQISAPLGPSRTVSDIPT